ncbi:MAG TPA: three-Cys-motif partner protein TcmP, partial [Gammaproteobacteria bacterium]|nr:three-Cys-motif partner protein TcmP [Gammaproteobacteria bacterium]
MKELARLEDDGLFIDEVGTWSEEKYQLVSAYASIFAASMRKKYKALVYIDMYAGPGRVKIKHTTRIYASSPINALNVDPPFDRLVFCELEDQKLEALKARCAAGYPNRDIHFVGGDVNDNANRILSLIPQHKRDHGVLTLCFVDPYQMKNLRFDTLRGLESRWIDFLVLIPSEMDGERAYRNYI